MTRPVNASVECRSALDSGHEAVRAVFEGLSAESRLMRFHVSTPRLREGHVRALSRVEPGVQDVVLAWVGGRPIGHGQWHALGDGTAELALAVVDHWQANGVGSALVRRLTESARMAGLAGFVCWVHPENAAVHRCLRRLGGRRDCEDVHAWHLDLDRMLASAEATWAEEAA